jgi:Transposase
MISRLAQVPVPSLESGHLPRDRRESESVGNSFQRPAFPKFCGPAAAGPIDTTPRFSYHGRPKATEVSACSFPKPDASWCRPTWRVAIRLRQPLTQGGASWYRRATRSRNEPLKRLVGTLPRHKPLFLNWFRAKATQSSGIVGGFNNGANLTIRTAYGYCFVTANFSG